MSRLDRPGSANIIGLLDYLHNPSHSQSEPIRVPADTMLSQLGSNQSTQVQYTVHSVHQALRQAPSLTTVLAYPLLSKDQAFSHVSLLADSNVWLLDTLIDLQSAQTRWAPQPPIPILAIAVDILEAVPEKSSFTEKAYTIVVLLCNSLVADLRTITEASEGGLRTLFCKAIILVAKAATHCPPIKRLTGSKLVNELSLLSSQFPVIGPDTDFSVRAVSELNHC